MQPDQSKVEPPIPGMTVMPYGLPMMTVAWLGCVTWGFSQPNFRIAFKEETGIDIESIALARGIDKMIDQATGRDREAVIRFIDWMTVNSWGVAE